MSDLIELSRQVRKGLKASVDALQVGNYKKLFRRHHCFETIEVKGQWRDVFKGARIVNRREDVSNARVRIVLGHMSGASVGVIGVWWFV